MPLQPLKIASVRSANFFPRWAPAFVEKILRTFGSLSLRAGIIPALAYLCLSACTEQSGVDYESVIPARRVLVQQAGWNNSHPSWHADGKRLLYCAAPAAGGAVQLREVTVSSNAVRTLYSDASGLSFPSYAPDGRAILCTSSRAGNQDLWLFTLTDSSWRRLTSLPGSESFPCWSPDGSRIALLSLGKILLLDPTAGTTTTLAMPLLIALSLSWSPDGESLLFSADDGSGEYLYRYLLAEERYIELTGTPLKGTWPVAAAKSPSGDELHIAWRAKTGYGAMGIYFYRPQDGSTSLVVMSGDMPAWSPDGTALVYVKGSDLVWEKIWIEIDE